MACQLARWINITDHPITFVRGVSGVPWPDCDSLPGEIVEAPLSYERVCREAGYTLVTPEMQASLDEEAQLKVMIAADEAAKAEAEAKAAEEQAQAEEAAKAGAETAVDPAREPEPVTVETAVRAEPAKGKRRGRSD